MPERIGNDYIDWEYKGNASGVKDQSHFDFGSFNLIYIFGLLSL